ncbi:MAG TPA: UPF0280 family protein [Stellaceae bacterium]|nr:UPF0280 family protein [Stellaceae bacterium]
MPGGAIRRMLPDGRRLHLQHGPIDLVIEAFGARDEIAAAYEQAWRRFQSVLTELVAELPLLRRVVDEGHCGVAGQVARRMFAACWPHRRSFITPMAAVAGAVADEVMAAMREGRALDRAYVNNGGDIALHLAPGARLDVGLVAELDHPALTGMATIESDWPVRGVATSGWRGRSFSLGIADAATVLAHDAAAADAAATLVANAVDIDHPGIVRARACDIDETSDLGERWVTRGVSPLPVRLVEEALCRGAALAESVREAGLIFGAVLVLQGRVRVVGPVAGPAPVGAASSLMLRDMLFEHSSA